MLLDPGSDPEFEEGGGRIENKVAPIALPGCDPGDGIADILRSYFSDSHHHEATNTMSSVILS
jgi:hypothetical protein